MKQLLLLGTLSLAAAVAVAEPQITGFTCVQDRLTTKVTTSFTLGGEAILLVDVQTNGVSIGWRNFRSAMTGASLNRVNPAGNYTLEWTPATSWPSIPSTVSPGQLSVVVQALSPDNPPDYMDIDLTANQSVAYYASTNDLPWAVTDDTYKTTHLLMRRIHAANKTWLMGSPSNEGGRTKKTFLETQHPVCLSYDYYIGVYELTQGQYANFGLTVPDGQSSVGPRYPLANVSYQALRGFWDCWWPDNGHKVDSATGKNGLHTMRQKTGVQFDFPLEAQWEFACRAGTTTAYIGGTASAASVQTYAIYSANAPTNASGAVVCAEVGTKLPNNFGLYDMIGNVSEFCLEQTTGNPGATYVCDPYGKLVNKDSNNVHFANRGSNYSLLWEKWSDIFGASIQHNRAAYRGDFYNTSPSSARPTLGVRLVAPVSRAWPVVTVKAGTVEQDSSRRVAITYELAEESIVTLELYKDGTRVSDEALRAVCGDVNRVVTTNGTKRIYWTPDASWEGELLRDGHLGFKIATWATNNPPPYMALDLRSAYVTNISYYASAEAMPEPITNDLWKTDYLVMRRIPAKDVTWLMGIATNAAGKSVEGGWSDEKCSWPHRVKFSQDFYIGVFELTCRQARIFESTSSATSNKANWALPFSCNYAALRAMTWPDKGHSVGTTTYLAKYSQRFGIPFDVPTESQWEYACRAGTDGPWHGFSNANDCSWNKSNATGLHAVGTRQPNAWGLYDMLGNAWEYCLDRPSAKLGLTDEQLASETPVVDPYGTTESTVYRVMRGGSYTDEVWQQCRSGCRTQGNHRDSNWGRTGFRLICPLPGETLAEPVLPTAE